MTRIASFTKIENEVLPKFRDSMAQAESTADVRKFFVYAMLELLNGVLERGIELAYEDVELAPGATPGYVLSPRLREHPAFTALVQGSDLTAILDRFAATAGNRFKRLEKNPEKTESKIYHGTGGPARA
jgi:hypothetical protein